MIEKQMWWWGVFAVGKVHSQMEAMLGSPPCTGHVIRYAPENRDRKPQQFNLKFRGKVILRPAIRKGHARRKRWSIGKRWREEPGMGVSVRYKLGTSGFTAQGAILR